MSIAKLCGPSSLSLSSTRLKCRRAALDGLFNNTTRRCYAKRPPPPGGLNLPPFRTWSESFRRTGKVLHRVSTANPETARKMAEVFVPDGLKDQVIIEAFPGPGQLTRALLALPKERIRKIIVLEDSAEYRSYLTPVQQIDDRLVVFPHSGQLWSTYDKLMDEGLLDGVEKHPWKTLHPQLRYISHVRSNVHGEQLVSQLIRFIPEQEWLFKYGRVPMNLVLGQWLFDRMTAPPEDKIARGKLTIVAGALANITSGLPFADTQPFEDHFYPPPAAQQRDALNSIKRELRKNRKVGLPYQTAIIEPREDALEIIGPGLMDKWDYCLRHMFVRKAQPVSQALALLGSNGLSLGQRLHDPNLPPEEFVDPEKPVRYLNVRDWRLILKAFDEWSFAPQELGVRDYEDRK